MSTGSSEQDQARQLAERIARRLAQHNNQESPATSAKDASADVGEELAAMRLSLTELQQKLAHIESHLTREERATNSPTHGARRDANRTLAAQPPGKIQSPWLSGMYVPAAHPSQERFGVEEDAVSELVDYFEREKTCNLEPGGKSCDHCSMCSSRGF
jgi:hypothetical protein